MRWNDSAIFLQKNSKIVWWSSNVCPVLFLITGSVVHFRYLNWKIGSLASPNAKGHIFITAGIQTSFDFLSWVKKCAKRFSPIETRDKQQQRARSNFGTVQRTQQESFFQNEQPAKPVLPLKKSLMVLNFDMNTPRPQKTWLLNYWPSFWYIQPNSIFRVCMPTKMEEQPFQKICRSYFLALKTVTSNRSSAAANVT